MITFDKILLLIALLFYQTTPLLETKKNGRIWRFCYYYENKL